jgi:hypothetical protein
MAGQGRILAGMTLLRRRRQPALIAAALAACLLASCSPGIGWGVVLWSSAEGPIPAGSVVPVYLKSNIQSLYVVGAPGGKKKVELPLWQVELFKSRRAAAARVSELGEYKSMYMVAAKDGVPIRERPSNGDTSTQVFRLREGQSVKILAKAEGEAVSTGSKTLPGDWYQVLADDGTRGYAFSYSFKVYDEAKEGPPVIASSKKSLTGRVDLVFTRSWRPEYFQAMLDDGRVDLDLFSLRYGLFVDSTHRQIRLELPGASELFTYSSISESDGVYSFEGSPLKARIESEKRLLLSWVDDAPGDAAAPPEAAAPGDDAAAGGAAEAAAQPPQDDASVYRSEGADGRAALIVLDAEPREAIRLEELRRQRLLESFADAGADWSSPEAGRLDFSKNRRFTWTGRSALPSGYLPEGLGDYGEAAFRLFLDKSLEGQWDGAFSLRFDPPASAEPGTPRPGWIDFAYRRTPEGLVLAPAVLGLRNLVVASVDSSASPLVLRPTSR